MAAVPEPTREQYAELENLIALAAKNNARKAVVGKAPDKELNQDRATVISDADLLKELKATRDPDQFPRRGPRRGPRENVSLPPAVFCAVHDGVVCTLEHGIYKCPDCAKDQPKEEFLSLKALL